MKEVLAIIPAREGSKGLPGKNIKLLAGHPLIAYSIKAAIDSPVISRTLVSTDSDNIAAIAKSYGAEVPFKRPSKFATDLSTDLEVFTHALNWLKTHQNYVPDFVVQLRPTSPVRFIKDIESCVYKLQNSDSDSLRVVTTSFNTPFKMWIIQDENRPMKPLLELAAVAEPFNQPRQNLPTVYWQTGTLDVIRTTTITQQNSMSGGKIIPFIIDQKYAVDIDDLESFNRAEEVVKKYDCIKF